MKITKTEAKTKTWVMWALLGVMTGLLVIGSGCCTPSGSREYIPGKGWVPND